MTQPKDPDAARPPEPPTSFQPRRWASRSACIPQGICVCSGSCRSVCDSRSDPPQKLCSAAPMHVAVILSGVIRAPANDAAEGPRRYPSPRTADIFPTPKMGPPFRLHSAGNLRLHWHLHLPFCLSLRAQRGTCFSPAPQAPVLPEPSPQKINSPKTPQNHPVKPPTPSRTHQTPVNTGDLPQKYLAYLPPPTRYN